MNNTAMWVKNSILGIFVVVFPYPGFAYPAFILRLSCVYPVFIL